MNQNNSLYSVPTLKMPKDTVVLGWHGKARAGKDTCVKGIIDTFSDRYDVRRYAFADELKNYCNGREQELAEQYGQHLLDPNPDMSDPLCPKGKHPRLLQYVGTEVFRAQDPFYWVRALSEHIVNDKPQIALIADCRFRNELFYVRAAKGYLINVTRPGFTDTTRCENHVSETGLDDFTAWDFTIINSGSVEELRADAVSVFESIVEQLTPPPSIEQSIGPYSFLEAA